MPPTLLMSWFTLAINHRWHWFRSMWCFAVTSLPTILQWGARFSSEAKMPCLGLFFSLTVLLSLFTSNPPFFCGSLRFPCAASSVVWHSLSLVRWCFVLIRSCIRWIPLWLIGCFSPSDSTRNDTRFCKLILSLGYYPFSSRLRDTKSRVAHKRSEVFCRFVWSVNHITIDYGHWWEWRMCELRSFITRW